MWCKWVVDTRPDTGECMEGNVCQLGYYLTVIIGKEEPP